MPRSLFETTPAELRQWLSKAEQPGFRAGQILKWTYLRDAADFAAMTDLPADLRERLAQEFALESPKVLARTQTPETLKLLLEMSDGAQVECVRIKMGRTYTACLSTQVGCSVGCVFCATGETGCLRNLTATEILMQLAALRRITRQERARGPETTAPPISNVVFMGMGEPLMNYDATVLAVRRMVDREGYGMSPGRISISTAGVPPMIRRLAAEGLGTELAVSLNAPRDNLRARLMPGVARWPLAEVLEACHEYSVALGGQPVTFAYVLVEGLNDDLEEAIELAKLLRRQPHHLNLIPLNPVTHASLQAPSKNRTHAFLEMARSHGLNASLRRSKGADIDAACGQLRGRVHAEAAKAAQPEATAAAEKPAKQAARPAAEAKAARPERPARPAAEGKPARPDRPARPSRDAKQARPATDGKPAATRRPARPATDDKPARPATGGKPAAARPSKPAAAKGPRKPRPTEPKR